MDRHTGELRRYKYFVAVHGTSSFTFALASWTHRIGSKPICELTLESPHIPSRASACLGIIRLSVLGVWRRSPSPPSISAQIRQMPPHRTAGDKLASELMIPFANPWPGKRPC